MNGIKALFAITALALYTGAKAQNYPLITSLRVLPPHLLMLADYVVPVTNKLILKLLGQHKQLLLNFPCCGTSVTTNPVQENVLFQRSPLGVSLYISNPHYKIALFRVWSADRDINDIINVFLPVIRLETDFNTPYGWIEPLSVPGTKYALRVQTVDEAGLLRFKN